MRQQRQADRHRVNTIGDEPAHEYQVAERPGHLLALIAHQRRMHVYPREHLRSRSVRHPGMRGAHLMVREHQVSATSLDVERDTEVLPRYRRALDVPARPAGSEI